ncbi:MAG: glycosyltransferase family 2 protein [Candidatus Cloacimonetes bacterium]|nr:glycosyltransferase family 2 protein [Candidatus Cloacimonadota bacterium]
MELSLLSVIIPIYNVKDYIARCIDSVINQSYQNLEIILINDGSTDKSGDICEVYARSDSRIRLKHKENGGLSSARNAGLEIATGDYITFLDSDDYIDLDTYAVNMDILNENRTIDIVQFPVERQNTILGMPVKPYLISGEKNIFANWWRNDVITSSVCNKIFRKKVFETIRFPIKQTHEDHFLIVNFSETTQNVFLSDKGCYHYVVRDDSITTSTITVEKCIDFFKAHMRVYKKFYSYKDLRRYRLTAFSRVYRKLVTAKRIDRNTNLKMYIEEIRKYMPKWKDIVCAESDIKEKIWISCVKIIGPKHFMNLYSGYLNSKEVEISL